MNQHKNFWEQDRTALHSTSSWFGNLPQLQKITYALLLIFIIGWCFFLGMVFSSATVQTYTGEILYGYTPPVSTADDNAAMEMSGSEVLLLVGMDRRTEEESSRTDTIMLAFIDWDAAAVKLLSLPRDTYIQLPGTTTKTKINAAYDKGGITLLRNTIEHTFGINARHYVEVDFSGFIKVIDMLDGVELDVPRDMKNLNEGIDLRQGLQTLNGADALAFVRFREKTRADIGRIERQQLFMQALAAKLASTSLLPKTPQLIPILLDNCRSDFSLSQIMKLSQPLTKLDLSSLQTYSLPGEGLYIKGVSYWVLDSAGCEAILAEIMGGQVGELNIIDDGGLGTEYFPSAQRVMLENEPAAEGAETEADGTEANGTEAEADDAVTNDTEEAAVDAATADNTELADAEDGVAVDAPNDTEPARVNL